jgi:hypothetical protein
MVQVNAKIEINLMLEPSIVKIQQKKGLKAQRVKVAGKS